MLGMKCHAPLTKVMKNLFLLTGIDLLSGVTNGILLGITCKINIFKEIQKIQSQFWIIFALQEARQMFEVSVYRTCAIITPAFYKNMRVSSGVIFFVAF